MGGSLGPQVIPRRHAPVEALARQGSFRGFPALNNNSSPFKRQLSLRMNDLPSTMQRNSDFPVNNTVPEVEGEGDSISSLCTQISSAFRGPPEDPFSQAPMPRPTSSPQSPVAPPGAHPGNYTPLQHKPRQLTHTILHRNNMLSELLVVPVSLSAVLNGPVFHPSPALSISPALPPPLPARDTNPWAKTPGHAGHHTPPAASSAHPGKDWSIEIDLLRPLVAWLLLSWFCFYGLRHQTRTQDRLVLFLWTETPD
uniref:NUMB domain-containing protein n=1 Tax=Hucho hucho TaxID=62062 RepID=A0A4W5K9A4_9TELE